MSPVEHPERDSWAFSFFPDCVSVPGVGARAAAWLYSLERDATDDVTASASSTRPTLTPLCIGGGAASFAANQLSQLLLQSGVKTGGGCPANHSILRDLFCYHSRTPRLEHQYRNIYI